MQLIFPVGGGFIIHRTTNSFAFLQFLNTLDNFSNVLVRRESFKQNIPSSKFATWLSYFSMTPSLHMI